MLGHISTVDTPTTSNASARRSARTPSRTSASRTAASSARPTRPCSGSTSGRWCSTARSIPTSTASRPRMRKRSGPSTHSTRSSPTAPPIARARSTTTATPKARSTRSWPSSTRIRSRRQRRAGPRSARACALNAVIQALYSQDLWPSLAEALNDAQHGDGDGLLALSDSYLERDDNGTWSNTIEAFIAISCLDDPVPTTSTPATLRGQFAKDAPRLGRSFAHRLPVRAVAGAASDRGRRRPAQALRRSSSSAPPATRSLPSCRAGSSPTRSRAACCSYARARAHRVRRGRMRRRCDRRVHPRPHRPRRRHPLLNGQASRAAAKRRTPSSSSSGDAVAKLMRQRRHIRRPRVEGLAGHEGHPLLHGLRQQVGRRSGRRRVGPTGTCRRRDG